MKKITLTAMLAITLIMLTGCSDPTEGSTNSNNVKVTPHKIHDKILVKVFYGRGNFHYSDVLEDTNAYLQSIENIEDYKVEVKSGGNGEEAFYENVILKKRSAFNYGK